MTSISDFPAIGKDELPGGSSEPSCMARSKTLATMDKNLKSCGVEYDLLLPKAAYLTMVGSYGAVIPFVPVFLKHVGIPVEQIGLLQTIRPAASFIASPIWAAVGDRFGVYKALLIFALVVSTILRLSMMWLTSFWAFACLMIIMEFIGTPTGSLLDATVMKILREDRRRHYGKQRLWGAVGFGLSAFLVGSLVSRLHDPYLYFPIHAAIMLCSLFAVVGMSVAAPKVSSGFWSNIKHVASSPRVSIFFVTVFSMGLGGGILGSYVSLHVQSLFEVPTEATTLVGLMQFVACSSEVVFFASSTIILEKLGPRMMISAAAFCFALRFAYYALLQSPWLVLPIEMLHGITWATFWAASQQYALSVAPPGMEGTLQGLLAGFYGGLGSGLGNFIGGFVNKSLGAPILFWSISAWLIFAGLIFVLTNLYLDRREGMKIPPGTPQSLSPNYRRAMPTNSTAIHEDDDHHSGLHGDEAELHTLDEITITPTETPSDSPNRSPMVQVDNSSKHDSPVI